MTDRITPEIQQLKSLIDAEYGPRGRFPDAESHTALHTALALLDQPAPPTSGDAPKGFHDVDEFYPTPEQEEAKRIAEERRELLDHFNKLSPADAPASQGGCYECDAIRSLILSAPKTVTREDIDYVVMGFMKQTPENRGLYLKTFFLSKGIEVVEDKSEGEDAK